MGMTAEEAKQILNSIIDSISQKPGNLVKNPGKDFTRDRKLPLKTMLRIMIGMQGGSLKRELFDYDPSIDVTASAFVQQRDKILPGMFEYIFREHAARMPVGQMYRGYRLFAVDGSDITIATNEDSDTYVLCSKDQGYNAFHLNSFYDILNKQFVDAVIHPKQKTGETKAAAVMAKRLPPGSKYILIGDRGYASLNLLETIHRLDNVDYLIRIRNEWLTNTRALPMAELDTDISFELRTTQRNEDKALVKTGQVKWISGKSIKGKKKKFEQWEFEACVPMNLRIVRFKITEAEYETIVTSLDRKQFPLNEIKRLYRMRWQIETSFRELKYAIGLINIHTKKEPSALQEIYARLIMYNYSQSIIVSAVVRQNDSGKWQYQVNVTFSMHLCRQFFRYHRAEPPPDIQSKIERAVLPIRPDRSDPRKIIRKGFAWFIYRVA